MVRRVIVAPYDDNWTQGFARVAQELRAILTEEVAAIHHIGSTAIPGMSAKPIIDVMVVVRDIERIDAYDGQMLAHGFEPRGENGIPGRRYYVRGTADLHTQHIHIFAVGNAHVVRHLAFRDYMIAHPSQALAYAELKERLAREFPADIDGYVQGKDAFIQEIDRQALAWRQKQGESEA